MMCPWTISPGLISAGIMSMAESSISSSRIFWECSGSTAGEEVGGTA